MLIAHSWLKETPWALLAMQPVAVAQAGMIQARLVLTISLIAISLLISTMIFFTIKKLVRQGPAHGRKRPAIAGNAGPCLQARLHWRTGGGGCP